MKNKLRTLHIGSIEYKYVIAKYSVRIYEPGTKQIKVIVPIQCIDQVPGPLDNPYWQYSGPGFGPGAIKEYIKNNLL